MIRRQAEVHQNAIGRFELQLAQYFRQIAIAGVAQVTPFAGHDRGCVLQHQRVTIETNQDSIRLNAFEDFSAVPTSADCAINDRQPRMQIEGFQCFPQQNRDVNRSQGSFRE